MKQHTLSQLTNDFFTAIFFCCVLIFSPSCVQQSRQFVQTNTQNKTSPQQTQHRININTATQEELEKLPTIGKEMAERVIEHRTRYGRFERIEHLLLVRGMSDKKFRDVRDFITVE